MVTLDVISPLASKAYQNVNTWLTSEPNHVAPLDYVTDLIKFRDPSTASLVREASHLSI